MKKQICLLFKKLDQKERKRRLKKKNQKKFKRTKQNSRKISKMLRYLKEQKTQRRTKILRNQIGILELLEKKRIWKKMNTKKGARYLKNMKFKEPLEEKEDQETSWKLKEQKVFLKKNNRNNLIL